MSSGSVMVGLPVTVAGPGWTVAGKVIEQAPTSVRVAYTVPPGPEVVAGWFHDDPSLDARHLKRMGDNSDVPYRLILKETASEHPVAMRQDSDDR